MPRFRPRVLAVLAVGAAAALTLAACGGDDSSSTTSASSSSSSASTGAGAATVDLSDNAALGTEVLVDSQGRTLYLFEKDDEADESYCSGACAEAWPPLTSTGQAGAGDGLDASQLTTFKREDGDTQVAYAGHPLYLYAGDTAPGDANGNGVDQFGAEWYAMDASGDVVEGDESGSAAGEDSTSEDTTSEDSSGGYSY